ncbi:MAG: NAD-dependent deacylase [Chitinophagales bacterium]|nr:NAD-dependent deacylase [Bacteroidota bacterium]
MRNIVVLSGAGISQESGLKTFRDADGLWEGHDVMEVASPQAWRKNPALVLRFYNERRRQLATVSPNAAHKILADLEDFFSVNIITQNVDNLHERGGSTKVIHLHGELTKARSEYFDDLVYNIDYQDINIGDTCERGYPLRPHIVWFGEAVPMIEKAISIVQKADVLVIIGTSLLVYPAASLMHYAPQNALVVVIDKKLPELPAIPQDVVCFEQKATEGVASLRNLLFERFGEKG